MKPNNRNLSRWVSFLHPTYEISERDRDFPNNSTHSRIGDWEVSRVQTYAATDTDSEFDTVAICYCQYSPVVTSLDPLPKVQIPKSDRDFQSSQVRESTYARSKML